MTRYSSHARRTPLNLCLALLAILVLLPTHGFAEDAEPHSAITPAPRNEQEFWVNRHARINERTKQGDIELIFLGDSITQGWENSQVQEQVWKKHYGDRQAANMGIGGDRTQHVLWRLDHGNVDGLDPKLVVLMIGTNNSNGTDNTADEIADGIRAIIASLREKLPQTKVLLLAIFPRGAEPNPQRDKNANASALAAECADGQMVHYLDIGEHFLDDEGRIAAEIMPDYLHLTVAGYQIWAEAIEDKVAELLGER